ncbi:MAG: YceI family protein [Neisseriaceae bacterium]
MAKFISFLLISTLGSLTAASPISVSNVRITEEVKNLIGPNLKLDYRKVGIDQDIDLRKHTGHVNLTIYSDSAKVTPHFLDSTIKDENNFDTKHYKTITFKSSKIHFTDQDEIDRLDGMLYLRNRSTPISFKKNSFTCKSDAQGKRTCNLDFTAPLDRTKLGLTYALKLGLSRQAPINIRATIKEQ